MMVRREPDDPRNSRIMLRRELVGDGTPDRVIAGLVAQGALHRLRHGAYVSGDAWRECDEAGRHGLVARAVLMQARADVVLSHVSALAEWDVPLWETPLHEVHITRLDRKCGRREVGVRQHLGALREGDVVALNGILVTSPTRTGMDSLTVLDVEHGLTVINDLLHRRLTTPAELSACRAYMERWPNTLKQDIVLRLADSRCESAGESRTLFLCWRQGLPRPVPQYVIRDASGVEVARVDFAWPSLKVFLEFDGRVKYQELLKPGESATDVVLREKRREEMICELTGWRCIRVSWADLYRPELVAARIRKLFEPAAAVL